VRLLLIEDSPRLRTTLAKALTHLGHAVDTAPDGEEGDTLIRIHSYDVVILDLMLPKRSGLDLLGGWRRHGRDTPIIVLTALDGVDDRVRGLALGADDYLTKPFAIAELDARVEAIARRRHGQADSRIVVRDLEIDLAARRVLRSGTPIALTAREFSLLECLARKPGQVLSREQIEAHLYSESDSPLSNAVDSAVYSLRRKLTPEGDLPIIQTRRGLGYVLEPE
jgi:two-component system copper resistance phosphate regulon response regulator CusR